MKKILISFLIFTLLISALVLHFVLPRLITEIKHPIVTFLRPNYAKYKGPTFEKDSQIKGKALSFKSKDGLILSAYLSYAQSESPKGTVILLHGIRAYKEHFIPLSKKLAARGFNTVAIDSRAHASSEGQHCTFGAKEKYDIVQLIDHLAQEENIKDNIGIWGQSLGGAIALQAMSIESRIEAGIVESTFSDFRTVTNDYFTYHAGFNIRPLTNYLINRAGKMADFDPNEVRPNEACQKITQPILLVHGTQDRRISIEYARENFAQLKSSQKEFVEFEEGNHLNIWKVGGEGYFERVVGFWEEVF